MKKIEYICDLCREPHSKDSAVNNIFSLFFLISKYELRKYNADCDKHICRSCVGLIKEVDLDKIS